MKPGEGTKLASSSVAREPEPSGRNLNSLLKQKALEVVCFHEEFAFLSKSIEDY